MNLEKKVNTSLKIGGIHETRKSKKLNLRYSAPAHRWFYERVLGLRRAAAKGTPPGPRGGA